MKKERKKGKKGYWLDIITTQQSFESIHFWLFLGPCEITLLLLSLSP